MSSTYEALMDLGARADEASSLAKTVVSALIEHGLVIPQPNTDCVPAGAGYPIGPRCFEAYEVTPASDLYMSPPFWELSQTTGVQVITEPWVNVGGFSLIHGGGCPRCRARLGEAFLDLLQAEVAAFKASAQVPSITCPKCSARSSVHDWSSHPHPGFVNLLIVFWNWASFDDRDWRLSVPDLLARAWGRPVQRTFGET